MAAALNYTKVFFRSGKYKGRYGFIKSVRTLFFLVLRQIFFQDEKILRKESIFEEM